MAEAEKIERLLARPEVRRLMRAMTAKPKTRRGEPKARRDGTNGRSCWLERFFEAYAGGSLRWHHLEFALPYLLTEYIRRKTGARRETLAGRVLGNPATRRGLVATVRSVGHLGLTQPQRFVAPLMVVWNFTQACNLQCRHCYQEAGRRRPDELTLDEQKRIVDILDERDVPLVAFSGGEPLMAPTFLEVVRYAARRGFHLTVATNGTLCTPDRVRAMVDAGLRYAEISLDSVDPSRHDAWRGAAGYWDRAVAGIRTAVRHKIGTVTYFPISWLTPCCGLDTVEVCCGSHGSFCGGCPPYPLARQQPPGCLSGETGKCVRPPLAAATGGPVTKAMKGHTEIDNCPPFQGHRRGMS